MSYDVLLVLCSSVVVFFVKQKTAYEMRISDWSSDVCSSDLLLSIFRRHRWLIGAIVAGVTLRTAVAVFTATPIFEATATVRVELVGGSGDEETANAAQNEARMETEARLYASRAMAEAVIKDLDLVDRTSTRLNSSH